MLLLAAIGVTFVLAIVYMCVLRCCTECFLWMSLILIVLAMLLVGLFFIL